MVEGARLQRDINFRGPLRSTRRLLPRARLIPSVTAPNGMRNDIEFRVPKPDNGGYWQNRLEEVIIDERGPQGKASYTVGGKMYGLEFREQWYIVGADSSFVLVAYKGDTQQGPYEGAFLYTQ